MTAPKIGPHELAALAIFEAMPRAQIVAAINEICVTLKGYGVPFRERLRLNDERHALRARLAQIDAASAAIATAEGRTP